MRRNPIVALAAIVAAVGCEGREAARQREAAEMLRQVEIALRNYQAAEWPGTGEAPGVEADGSPSDDGDRRPGPDGLSGSGSGPAR